MNKKRIITFSLIVLGIIIVAISSTYAILSFFTSGSTENTITTGSITFHYEEIDGMGRGIIISDALPVESNDTAKSNSPAFNFKINSTTSSDVDVPYIITAKLTDDSDVILGDIVDIYLTSAPSSSSSSSSRLSSSSSRSISLSSSS